MNSYTKGPWEDVGANEQGERCIYGSDDSAVAVTIPCGNPDQWPDRSISNARLIVSAPDLVIELRQAIIQMEMAAECIENGRYDEALLHVSSLMRNKKKVLAKATGESA